METDHPDARQETACQSTKPTHSAPRQQQRAQGLFAKVLSDPEKFRASQATEYTGDAGVVRVVIAWEPSSSEFALEYPQTNERAYGDEDAETRDLELTDAKKDGIDRALANSLLRRPPCPA